MTTTLPTISKMKLKKDYAVVADFYSDIDFLIRLGIELSVEFVHEGNIGDFQDKLMDLFLRKLKLEELIHVIKLELLNRNLVDNPAILEMMLNDNQYDFPINNIDEWHKNVNEWITVYEEQQFK